MPYRHRRKLAAGCALIAAAAGLPARAQIATLDKGHSIIVNNGLQIWGVASDIVNYDINYGQLQGANMNGVMWGFPANGYTPANGGTETHLLSAGQKWAKWTDWQYNGTTVTPQTALTATEQAHVSDLIAVQVGDEINQSDMETGSMTRNWLLAAGNGTATTADDVFPNSLLYVNSFHIINHGNYANFLQQANPDAISWDSYPFANPHGHYITPTNWLSLGQQFRRHGLGSYIGATNAAPRPYGMFLQTYNDSFAVDPGEVQMRWQQFAAWTMGYKFADAFIYSGGNNNFGSNTAGPVYQGFKESARQGRNLGPALTRLISYGYGTSIVQGLNAGGQTNPVPGDWLVFNKDNAPPAQRYLTNVSATYSGPKNGGNRGDVYVGFFNPLHASFGDPAGTVYFMVMNGMGGDLTLPNGQSDNTATVAETTQQLTLDFDMGHTTLNSLERLNRNTGQIETVPLTFVSGTTWRYTFDLEGGTGDLFKYNDGHVFVGAETVQPTVYWDNDANAANNNTTTGAGLGGAGNWDTISNKWSTGASNGTWQPNRNPVFWGTGGTVNIVSPPSVDSLTFRSNGYTISGSSIFLSRPFVNVDAGVTATISSAISSNTGLTKSGPGTLRLTGSNNHLGTTINEGVVQVSSDAALGVIPASLRTNIALDGGTLQWGANFDLNNNRAIALGPNGGTIDTQGFTNPSGYNATAGGFRGPGDLTKIGSGTFFSSVISGGANTTWKGRLILKEGTWRINASDGLPYNVLPADGLKADQVTFDGGTLQLAITRSITNALRGMTVAAGGGTIDTPGVDLTWAGPLAGVNTTSNFNKTGSGMLRFTGVGTASTYNGNVNVNAGTLRLDNGNTMGDLASVNLANVSGATLNVTGNETIGSLAGGGTTGGNVTLSAITLTTGGNNKTTTFAGVVSGAGGVTKTGTGTMTMTGANTYTGGTTLQAGTLQVSRLQQNNPVTINAGTLRVLESIPGLSSGHPSGNVASLSRPSSLTIANNGAPLGARVYNATLDLTNNDLILDYSGASPVASIEDMIRSGFNGTGNWLGKGIASSVAAADGNYVIAIADNALLPAPFGTAQGGPLFAGVNVDLTTILIKFTHRADINLDGLITPDDSAIFGGNYDENQFARWSTGDMDYDGIFTPDDAAIFGGAYDESLTSLPEPGSLIALALMGIGCARRRRHGL